MTPARMCFAQLRNYPCTNFTATRIIVGAFVGTCQTKLLMPHGPTKPPNVLLHNTCMYNRVDGMINMNTMMKYNALCKDLVGKHQNSFEGEASGTEVEEVL